MAEKKNTTKQTVDRSIFLISARRQWRAASESRILKRRENVEGQHVAIAIDSVCFSLSHIYTQLEEEEPLLLHPPKKEKKKDVERRKGGGHPR